MIEQIRNTSIADIHLNIDFYVQKFLTDGILFFKGLNPTIQQQWDITCLLGELMGFVPNFSNGNIPISPFFSPKNENHKHTFNRYIKNSKKIPEKNDIFIEWHIENIHKENPQVAASWNMLKFDCHPESGTTGFVNMVNFFDTLPEEWKSFLKKVKIKFTKSTDTNGVAIDDRNFSKNKEYSIVTPHYKTKKAVLRMGLNSGENFFCSIDEKPPTIKQINLFNEIEKFIIDSITLQSQIPNWITWSKGDFVIVDLFLMAHAVRGGFNIDERIFSRVWAYQKKPIE
jgi:alpha-ketoglutarate-dependent taurine dioxygenase